MNDSMYDFNKILEAWVYESSIVLYVKNWMDVHKYERILFFRLGTENTSCQQLSSGDDLLLTKEDDLTKVKSRIQSLLAKYIQQGKVSPVSLFFAYGNGELR